MSRGARGGTTDNVFTAPHARTTMWSEQHNAHQASIAKGRYRVVRVYGGCVQIVPLLFIEICAIGCISRSWPDKVHPVECGTMTVQCNAMLCYDLSICLCLVQYAPCAVRSAII